LTIQAPKIDVIANSSMLWILEGIDGKFRYHIQEDIINDVGLKKFGGL